MKKITFCLSLNLSFGSLLLYVPLLAAVCLSVAQASVVHTSHSPSAITEEAFLWPKLSAKKPLLKRMGAKVFIQILKEERRLELYTEDNTGHYQLTQSYTICNYSGGLGPKTQNGDFKSPEGFYHVSPKQLNPNSHYYRAINLGFPNELDKSKGYSGNHLMIHGECKSIGCYAMTNRYMDEIYQYAESAFQHGQHEIKINIYPFRMTPQNMMRHRNNNNYLFWRQLQPAYAYFIQNSIPATVNVIDGQYVVNVEPKNQFPLWNNKSNYLFSKVK
ncbi:putative L,D-transpeptidase YafK [Xenorhabdus poinarii G6]|uniref:Putative L,D-transpeptidase YafK n=1 Tax=Xenorhabdus poinarii G6 TaxID=1354304 RepID=A0A068R5I1_9GAMM|nr:murein L,D-transpeptidase family protein [Xenorhabdus poinarii]CDG22171.1 putative L,D-transpeptidase YafK [Xenorhabdus poinarii G6]